MVELCENETRNLRERAAWIQGIKRENSRGARGYSRYELHRRNPRALYTRKRCPPGADQSDLDGDTMSKHCRNPPRPRRPTHLPEWPLLRAHQGAHQYGCHTTNLDTPRKHSCGAPLGTPPKSKHFPPSLDDTSARKNVERNVRVPWFPLRLGLSAVPQDLSHSVAT